MLKQYENGVKIYAFEAANLYQEAHGTMNTHCKKLAMLPSSLFLEYARKHSVRIQRGETRDIIIVKFSYGVKNVISSDKLREEFYRNGIEVAWYNQRNKIEVEFERHRYTRLFRTPNKAKKGEVYFIREDLRDTFLQNMTMDLLKLMDPEDANIVGMDAYCSLVCGAAAEGFVHIDPDSILILEDKKVPAKIRALRVELENNQFVVRRPDEPQEVSNTIWDGMGIVEQSLFDETGLDGFMYCRSDFFKCCMFPGKIQKYFRDWYGADYDTVEIKDMFGVKHRVADIRVITTSESVKWLKFSSLMDNPKKMYRHWLRWIKTQRKCDFAVIKTAHPSKYGDLQRMSYQMVNTLGVSEDALRRIAHPSIEYINRLKEDDDFFMDYLRRTNADYKIHGVLLDLYEWNSEFKNTELFRDYRKRIISDLKRHDMMIHGKLFQSGDNLTLLGNPLALLMYATGQDPMQDPSFKVVPDGIQCYTERFPADTWLAGFRSPHNAPHNILPFHNIYPEALRKYFPKLGSNVLVINTIGTDCQDRGNGLDYDSDFMTVTDQKDIVEFAKEAYRRFPTIINAVADAPINYDMTPKSYSDMDNKIANGQLAIGASSDLAQKALSHFWNTGGTDRELEDIFVICSVIAQLAIDGAKKDCGIELVDEIRRLERIMKKKGMSAAPIFFRDIQKMRPNKKNADMGFLMDCPMDKVSVIINDDVIWKHQDPYTYNPWAMKDVFQYKYLGRQNWDNAQYHKLWDLIKDYHNEVNALNRETDRKEYKAEALSFLAKFRKQMRSCKIKKGVMAKLIDDALKDENSDIRMHMLILLHHYNPDTFISCFKTTKEIEPDSIEAA